MSDAPICWLSRVSLLISFSLSVSVSVFLSGVLIQLYSYVLLSNGVMRSLLFLRFWQPENAHKGCDHTHTCHEAQTPGPPRETGALHPGAEDAVHPRSCKWQVSQKNNPHRHCSLKIQISPHESASVCPSSHTVKQLWWLKDDLSNSRRQSQTNRDTLRNSSGCNNVSFVHVLWINSIKRLIRWGHYGAGRVFDSAS